MDTYTLFTEKDIIKKWSREISECYHINIPALLEKAETYHTPYHAKVPENIDRLDRIFLVCFDALTPFIFPIKNLESLFTSLKMHVFSKVFYTAGYLSSSGSFELSRFCQTPPPWNDKDFKLDSQVTRNYARFLETGAKTSWAHHHIHFSCSPACSEKKTSYVIGNFLPLFDWLLLILSVGPYSFSDSHWNIKGRPIKTIFEGKKEVRDIQSRYVKDYLSKGFSTLGSLLDSFCETQDKDSSLSVIDKFLYYCRFESATGICFLSDIIPLLINYPEEITFDILASLEKMPVFFRKRIISEVEEILKASNTLPDNFINDLNYLIKFLIPLSEKLFSVLVWKSEKEDIPKIRCLFSEYYDYVLNYEPPYDHHIPGIDFFTNDDESSSNTCLILKQEEILDWYDCKAYLYLKDHKYNMSESELKKLSNDAPYTLGEFLRYKYSPYAPGNGSESDVFYRNSLASVTGEEQQNVFYRLFLHHNTTNNYFSKQYIDYLLHEQSFAPPTFFTEAFYVVKTLYGQNMPDNIRKITFGMKEYRDCNNHIASNNESKEKNSSRVLVPQQKKGIIPESVWIDNVTSTEVWKYLYEYIIISAARNTPLNGSIPDKLTKSKEALENICHSLIKKHHPFFFLGSRITTFAMFGIVTNNKNESGDDSKKRLIELPRLSYDHRDLLICDYCFTLLCNLPHNKDVLSQLEAIPLE